MTDKPRHYGPDIHTWLKKQEALEEEQIEVAKGIIRLMDPRHSLHDIITTREAVDFRNAMLKRCDKYHKEA